VLVLLLKKISNHSIWYQINFFAKYHRSDYEFSILTSDSSRLWTASGDQEDLRKVDEAYEKEHRVRIYRLPAALDRRTRQNLWMKGLIRTIQDIHPDILFVHTIESYSAQRIILSRRILSGYSIFFDTHTLLNQFKGGIKSRLHLWFLKRIASKRICKYDAKVFATVPENRMILQRDYGIPSDRILYSPIGTDLSIFNFDNNARIKLRKEEMLAEEATVLLYTGKINHRKNPHLILEAVSLIQQQIKNPLYVYFVGAYDQVYFDEKMEISFNSAYIYVKFVPAVPVSELYAWYSMADFAVFPCENTLSALDAQACRLPVIMQEDMTNLERLSHGGLTYAPGDIKDLSEKILTMIDHPDQRKAIGLEGEKYIRTTYDYSKIVEKMEFDLGL